MRKLTPSRLGEQTFHECVHFYHTACFISRILARNGGVLPYHGRVVVDCVVCDRSRKLGHEIEATMEIYKRYFRKEDVEQIDDEMR